MKKSILKTFLYSVGILLICYPLCARFIEYKNQTKSVYNYKKEIAIMEEKEKISNVFREDCFETMCLGPRQTLDIFSFS